MAFVLIGLLFGLCTTCVANFGVGGEDCGFGIGTVVIALPLIWNPTLIASAYGFVILGFGLLVATYISKRRKPIPPEEAAN
jgi:hypothetical protein